MSVLKEILVSQYAVWARLVSQYMQYGQDVRSRESAGKEGYKVHIHKLWKNKNNAAVGMKIEIVAWVLIYSTLEMGMEKLCWESQSEKDTSPKGPRDKLCGEERKKTNSFLSKNISAIDYQHS